VEEQSSQMRPRSMRGGVAASSVAERMRWTIRSR
jgi:hypothetical protein